MQYVNVINFKAKCKIFNTIFEDKNANRKKLFLNTELSSKKETKLLWHKNEDE